jgi:RimJ/RimL family protein N-acetyltransferase
MDERALKAVLEKGTIAIKETEYQYTYFNPVGLRTLMEHTPAFAAQLERTIQLYRGQDHFRIGDLLREHAEDPETRQTFYLVLHDKDVIVSTCRLLYKAEARFGYINLVYTNPEYRGRQICQHTLELMIQKTKGMIDTYELDVDSDNGAAKTCYERSGFAVVAENKEEKEYKMRRTGEAKARKTRKARKARKARKTARNSAP